MAREKLSKDAIADALAADGWALAADGASITRTFIFKNFSEAFGFMTRVALAAEKLDHHPDWSNVYKTVEVKLNTHDAGGLTELDFELAKRMNRYSAASAAQACQSAPHLAAGTGFHHILHARGDAMPPEGRLMVAEFRS